VPVNRKPLRIILALAVMIAAVAATGCAANTSAVTPPAQLTAQAAPSAGQTLAEARVVPRQSASLSFSIPGIVEKVFVKEGEPVAEGQVIARLKGSDQVQSLISQAQVQVLAAQKALDDLDDKAKLAAADAQLQVASAQIELKNAKDARQSLDYQKVTQNTLDILRARYLLAQREFTDAQSDYESVKNRSDTDLDKAAALDLLSAKRQIRDQALYNLNKALERPEQNAVDEAQARLILAEAALADAQSTYAKLQAGPDPDQLQLLQARLADAQSQLKAAQTSLSNLDLKAPFAGTLISSGLEVGEGVAPQTVIMLGDVSSWKIETTDLTELDVPGVKEGDQVQVTFDAVPDLTLPGHVTRIREIGEDQQGDIVYKVYIDLDKQDSRLLWNMKAFVSFGSKP
jgi:multidrug efflux pump subunit AcrA (membrane-fusion protein)